MKSVILGAEVCFKPLAQSSAYNVHTFNASSNAEETWLVVLCLSGRIYNFQCLDRLSTFREYEMHMQSTFPFWSDGACVIGSSVLQTESNERQLFVLINVNQSPYLAMFNFDQADQRSPSWQFVSYKCLIFCPCFVKRFPGWSQQVIVSAVDGRVSLLCWNGKRLETVEPEDRYVELNERFPSGVIAVDAAVVGTTRITAIGCADGHLIVFHTAHCLNQVLRKTEVKLFDAPVSVLALIPDLFGEMHMVIASAVGAARLYANVSDRADWKEFVKLTVPYPLDAILCACHVRVSNGCAGRSHLIYIGTFCCKLLIFSCECSKGIFELVYMRSFLSPVVSIVPLNSQIIVVTATGMLVFKTD